MKPFSFSLRVASLLLTFTIPNWSNSMNFMKVLCHYWHFWYDHLLSMAPCSTTFIQEGNEDISREIWDLYIVKAKICLWNFTVKQDLYYLQIFTLRATESYWHLYKMTVFISFLFSLNCRDSLKYCPLTQSFTLLFRQRIKSREHTKDLV